MDSIHFMLATLVIGTITLMAGILFTRDSGRSLHDALRESMVWGTGYFFTLGAQILILANLG